MSTQQIQALLNELAGYARAKDVDGILSLYHPNAKAFDFGGQAAAISLAQIRQNCIQGYTGLTGRLDYEFIVDEIIVDGEVGYCFGVERISGEREGAPFAATVLATYGFRKHEGRWLIAHQHLSGI